jgi:hypothetical protein
MSVFDEVFVAPNYSESEELSEDIPLTRELLRFANVQLGTRCRSLEEFVSALFGDSVSADCLRYVTRVDRAELLLSMGMLAVLKPLFF